MRSSAPAVPPFTWWRGLQARKLLEDYFAERVRERRGKEGNDLLTVLCHTEDEDGNSFSDEDIVNHMIFLMMAAHDTSTINHDDDGLRAGRQPATGKNAAATSPIGSATGRWTSSRWRSWNRSTW